MDREYIDDGIPRFVWIRALIQEVAQGTGCQLAKLEKGQEVHSGQWADPMSRLGRASVLSLV